MDIDELRDTISIQEAAKRLGKSKKTIYRWVESGKIPALRAGREYFIKIDVVEALASGQGVQRDDVVQRVDTMDMRLQMLEYRMANLERRVDAIEVDDDLAIRISDVEQRLAEMEQERKAHKEEVSGSPVPLAEVSPIITPRKPQAVSRVSQDQTEAWPVDIPPDSVLDRHFAMLYNIKPRTFRDHIKVGIGGEKIDAIRRQKPGRPHEEEYWLTVEQQVAAEDFLRRHGKI